MSRIDGIFIHGFMNGAEEMKKHQVCADSLPPVVFWHKEDEGSNWDVDILMSPTSSLAQAEECEGCIQEAVQALRAKYNVAEPG
jgi:hypothetical protein